MTRDPRVMHNACHRCRVRSRVGSPTLTLSFFTHSFFPHSFFTLSFLLLLIRKHIRTHILYLSISQTLTHTHTHTLTHSHTHKQGTACKGRRYADLPACKKMRREHKTATTSVKPKSTYRVTSLCHQYTSTKNGHAGGKAKIVKRVRLYR